MFRSLVKKVILKSIILTGSAEIAFDTYYYFKYKKHFGEHAFYAGKKFKINYEHDVAIVFYCGIGDLLYGIPALKQISTNLKRNGKKFHAYTASSTSTISNKAIYNILSDLEIFDSVATFLGRPSVYWKYFNWSYICDDLPSKVEVFPFIYNTNKSVNSRVESVLNQFDLSNLSKKIDVSGIIDLKAQNCHHLIDTLRNTKNIIFCHFDTRSGGYLYPHTKEVYLNLIDRGYTIISVTKTDIKHDRYYELPVSKYTIWDTIKIVRELSPLVVAINSIMWPIGLIGDSRLLAFHYLISPDAHHFHYSQMKLYTPMKYCVNRAASSFLVEKYWHYEESKEQPYMIDYYPEFIINEVIKHSRSP